MLILNTSQFLFRKNHKLTKPFSPYFFQFKVLLAINYKITF
jgi:hypothetical protein